MHFSGYEMLQTFFLKIYKQYRPHDKTGFVLGELNIFNLCIWLRSKVSYALMQRFSFCWVRGSFRFSNSDTGSICIEEQNESKRISKHHS